MGMSEGNIYNIKVFCYIEISGSPALSIQMQTDLYEIKDTLVYITSS